MHGKQAISVEAKPCEKGSPSGTLEVCRIDSPGACLKAAARVERSSEVSWQRKWFHDGHGRSGTSIRREEIRV